MKKFMGFISAILLFSSCMFQNASNDELKSINIQLMKPANIDVARVECVVSAVDMETIIADLAVSQTLISGVITNVPYGDDRKFELFCYDSDSILTYYGSSIANIYAQNPVIEIVLNSSDPLADVTIIGHFADNQATEEKVVFVSDWDGFKNIYIMDTNGMNVRQLTFTENYKYHPRLSPDRSTVAFDGNEGDGMKLFFLDLATNQIDTLAFDGLEPVSPSWHPDGKSILFHAHYPYKKDIYKYNLMTDELTCLLANDTRNWAPVFSPDGEKVLFYSEYPGYNRLYMMNANGSDLHLLDNASPYEERVPKFNPQNQTQVLFSGRSAANRGGYDLYIADISQQQVQYRSLLTDSSSNLSWPEWSPDGEVIIYEKRKTDGNYGIYTVNADGSNDCVLIDNVGNEWHPHWR